MEIIKSYPGLFLECSVYFISTIMAIRCKFLCLNKADFSLSEEKAEALVRKDCNDFLKTKQGVHYLSMKYPNLSISQAIDEYVKNALWINYIV